MNTADLEQVFGADAPDRLTRETRLALLEANTRITAWLAAQRLDLLAAISRADTTTEEWDTLEIGALLHLSPPAATAHVHHARRLHDTFPTAIDALRAGTISERHLNTLVRSTWPLDPDTARGVAEQVLPAASDQTPAQFARTLARAVHRLDPAGETERHHSAADQRRVEITPDLHGMAQLWAYLPADGAATLRAAIEAVATQLRTDEPDGRTLDQLRADALVSLGTATLADPQRSRWHGRAAAVRMTVAASTLNGSDDEPAELTGYGPISAAVARRLAQHATTDHAVFTDAAGRVVGSAHLEPGYRPTAALRTHVIDRDRTCTFPTCSRPAERCDLDHLVPASHGGPTSAANLHALCARHHRAKHQAGWQPTRRADGTTTWHSPAGRIYTTRPEPYPTTTDPPG